MKSFLIILSLFTAFTANAGHENMGRLTEEERLQLMYIISCKPEAVYVAAQNAMGITDPYEQKNNKDFSAMMKAFLQNTEAELAAYASTNASMGKGICQLVLSMKDKFVAGCVTEEEKAIDTTIAVTACETYNSKQ